MRCKLLSFAVVTTVLIGNGFAPAIGYTDAEVLALEISGELLAPPAILTQVESDLIAIRTEYSYFETIHVFPDWEPGELIVKLTAQAFAEFMAGEYHGMDDLNAKYGPVEMTVLIADLNSIFLDFLQNYNPILLAEIYVEAEGVVWVHPNGFFGDGNDIYCNSFNDVHIYTFRRAWGDCFGGCVYQHIWVIAVQDGEVDIIESYGDPPPEPTSATDPWSFIGRAKLFQNSPNPFNPNTSISFSIPNFLLVKLTICGIDGRHVSTLTDNDYTPGPHSVTWNGTDENGRAVASGTYIYRL